MYADIQSNKRDSVLLITIFIIVIIGLGYIFDIYTGSNGYAGIWLAIFISFIMTSVSYFKGDKIALWTNGAKPIKHSENKYVYNMVENLCIANGMTVPKIYIIQDNAINAFATGRKPELASIALTTGAIEKLNNEELEGVIAHELSHIKNYDIRFMTLVAILVGTITILSHLLIRIRWFGGSRNNRSGGGQFGLIILIVGIVIAILSPIIAEIIKLAISRRREYLADASAALLTRYPDGLANALKKIEQDNIPMKNVSTATAHLFIANPFKKKQFASLFSTHPPIKDRINKLNKMGV